MTPTISVVVPVYKVEKYIDKCIESIINQSYKELDIILVDDGSPDECAKKCELWKSKDKRIRVIHKENGGLSDARNAGIKISKGDFITFVDSDDYVMEHYVEYLMELQQKYNADITICSFFELNEKDNTKIFVGGEFEKVFTPIEAIETMLYDRDFYTCAWGKLYRKSYFENIKYPKGMLYEDLATTYKLLDKAKIIAYGPKHLYCYLQREGSILNSTFNKKNFELISVADELQKDLEEMYPQIENAIIYRKVCAYMDTANMIIDSKTSTCEKELDSIINTIKKYKLKAIKLKETSLMQKILIGSSMGGTAIYRRTYTWQKKIKRLIERGK